MVCLHAADDLLTHWFVSRKKEQPKDLLCNCHLWRNFFLHHLQLELLVLWGSVFLPPCYHTLSFAGHFVWLFSIVAKGKEHPIKGSFCAVRCVLRFIESVSVGAVKKLHPGS